MNEKPHAYYSVIEDNRDEHGYGDYLHQYRGSTYTEAKAKLEAHPECSHIDYFDGEEWHYNYKE